MQSGKVVLARVKKKEEKNRWRSSGLLGSPPRPARSTSCSGGAAIGLGTARCPAAACPMSPVKRGCIRGRGKAVGPLCPLGATWLTGCRPGCLPAGCLTGWSSISVGWRVQLDAHRELRLNLAQAQSTFAPVFSKGN